jgi:hypothetical protein
MGQVLCALAEEEAAFDAVQAESSAMTMEQAIAYALENNR